MLESVQRASGEWVPHAAAPAEPVAPIAGGQAVPVPNAALPMERTGQAPAADAPADVVGTTSADVQNAQPGSPVANAGTQPEAQAAAPSPNPTDTAAPARKSWKPKASGDDVASVPAAPATPAAPIETATDTGRKAWKPKAKSDDVSAAPVAAPTPAAPAGEAPARKAWNPKAKADDVSPTPVTAPQAAAPAETAQPAPAPAAAGERKKWTPKAAPAAEASAPASPAPVAQANAPIIDPLPQPDSVQASTVQATAPAATGERPKWQPKAKASTTPQATGHTPQAAQAEPITEHVQLAQVGENKLEEGVEATSHHGGTDFPTQPTTEPSVNAETGRKKWQPKKKD